MRKWRRIPKLRPLRKSSRRLIGFSRISRMPGPSSRCRLRSKRPLPTCWAQVSSPSMRKVTMSQGTCPICLRGSEHQSAWYGQPYCLSFGIWALFYPGLFECWSTSSWRNTVWCSLRLHLLPETRFSFLHFFILSQLHLIKNCSFRLNSHFSYTERVFKGWWSLKISINSPLSKTPRFYKYY